MSEPPIEFLTNFLTLLAICTGGGFAFVGILVTAEKARENKKHNVHRIQRDQRGG